MKDERIKIKWETVPQSKPVYNRISIGLQQRAKEIGNRIAVARFDLNALIEIYKTPHILETFRKHQFLIIAANAIDFKYIVSINKLYNPKEPYSLIKLFKTLINDYKRIDWFSKIELNEIKALRTELDNSNTKIIEEIKTLRDKRYAHEDVVKLDLCLKFDDLMSIQAVLEKTYNSIRYCIDGTEIAFDKQVDISLDAIVHRIINYDNLHYEVLEAKCRKDNEMKTETIYNLLTDKTYKR